MEKSIATAITQIYPHLTPFVDFKVIDEGNGQEIVDWTATDTVPTQVQLDNAWLEVYKANKIAELQDACNTAIAGGFTSSALGTVHTYPSHDKAQSNFNTVMHRFLSDPAYTSCKFFTEDAGWLTHTKDQFFQVFHEGHDYGNAQWDKLFGLIRNVGTAADEPGVDAITW